MNKKPYIICTIIYSIFVVVCLGFFIASFHVIGYNQSGMLQNRFTKKIDSSAIYRSGRYLISPFHKWGLIRFLIYPNWMHEIKFNKDGDYTPVTSTTLDTAFMTIEATIFYTTQNYNMDKVSVYSFLVISK